MKIDGKLVGRELKALRIKNNLTAEEVCNNISVNRTSLYKYEKDASDIKYKTFEEMLNFYGINPAIFFKMLSEYIHTKEE